MTLPVPLPLATLDDLKLYSTEWDEANDALAVRAMLVGSEKLRTVWRQRKRNLDAELFAGITSALLVSDVICGSVTRYLDSRSQAELASATESAGPYSFSYTPLAGGKKAYFTKDELSSLGLGTWTLRVWKSSLPAEDLLVEDYS